MLHENSQHRFMGQSGLKFLKILKKQKLPENRSVDKDVEKSETGLFLLGMCNPTAAVGNSTAVYTKPERRVLI